MTLNDFKDCLFNVLNDTDELPIADIEVEDGKNSMKIVMEDGSQFLITSASYGTRFLVTSKDYA